MEWIVLFFVIFFGTPEDREEARQSLREWVPVILMVIIGSAIIIGIMLLSMHLDWFGLR